MDKKRMVGISIFGWVIVTIGVVLFLLTLEQYIKEKDIVYQAFRGELPWFIVGTCYLVIGIGILNLRRWAWYSLFWLGGLSLFLQPVLLFGAIWGGPVYFKITLFIVILYTIFFITALIYFTRPKVKELFKKRRSPNA